MQNAGNNGHSNGKAHPFQPTGARGATRGRAAMEMLRAAVDRGMKDADGLLSILEDARETAQVAKSKGNERLLMSALRLMASVHDALMKNGISAADKLEKWERLDAGEVTERREDVTIAVPRVNRLGVE